MDGYSELQATLKGYPCSPLLPRLEYDNIRRAIGLCLKPSKIVVHVVVQLAEK